MDRALDLAEQEDTSTEQALSLFLWTATTIDNWCLSIPAQRLPGIFNALAKRDGDNLLKLQARMVLETILGDCNSASQTAEQSVKVALERGASRDIAKAARLASLPLRFAGRFAEADEMARLALDHAAKTHDLWLQGSSLDSLSSIQLETGRVNEAIKSLESAQSLGIANLSERHSIYFREGMAHAAFLNGNYSECLRHAHSVLSQEGISLHARAEATLLSWTALASLLLGDTARFDRDSESVLKIWAKGLGHFGGIDIGAITITKRIELLEGQPTAQAFVRGYLSRQRRRLGPINSHLASPSGFSQYLDGQD